MPQKQTSSVYAYYDVKIQILNGSLIHQSFIDIDWLFNIQLEL